jgi:Xaa-Pro aminopeptidase
VPDVLIYGDTVRSQELRHEVPLTVPDPFLYAETDGARHVANHTMELARMGDLGLELHPWEEFGIDELLRSDRTPDEIRDELALRICRGLGIEDAVVPFWFPLQLADHLRANGVRLRADRQFFADRRRVKSAAELAGIRRAQAAAQAGMEVARDLLRRAEPNGAGLVADGEPLTVERIKLAMSRAFVEHGTSSDEFIVSHGPQSAVGHEAGSGQLAAGEPIVIDIWPRDNESACFTDMTRTFVVGDPPADVVEWQRLCKEALDRSLAAVKPGVTGREVNDAACEVFERAGYPTPRTKEDGKPLSDGFFHSLGHGVGLSVHEEPNLGLIGDKELVPGDVVSVEPGLYREGFGGCRLEDLVLVTDDGAENLTSFPYELTP